MNNKKKSDTVHYNKAQKLNKNYMYNDLKRSNCYGSDFTGSNFNFASFRGAHYKSCNFFGCTFEYTEFIGTNLKKSKFKRAKFENAVFEGANLDGVEFKDAEFNNVIFVNTDLSTVKNMEYKDGDIRIFQGMPNIDISNELSEAIKVALENEYIKRSRVLDNKDGDINSISVLILLEQFTEKIIIDGLKKIQANLDKDFSTLSYIIKALKKYINDGTI